MKLLIIEDERQPARRLQRQLAQLLPRADVAPIIGSVEEAISVLSEPPFPDLIFMDIHLSDGDSFEILDHIRIPTPIIFTTAYDSYALQAFKANSIDYLLKPIKQEELQLALEKWQNLTSGSHLPSEELTRMLRKMSAPEGSHYLKRLLIRFPEKIKAIDISKAAYFHVESRVTLMQLFDGKQYPVDFNLDQLERKLDPGKFFRANRKFLIRFEAIHQMHTYSKSRLRLELVPQYEGEIYVSSEKSAAFKRWLIGG